MQALRLTQEDLHETLERAREIAHEQGEWVVPDVSCAAYLEAAEEVGIPREAILQALRERHPMLGRCFEAGQTVFAPSIDEFWYPAQIVSVGEHTAEVRFVNGDSHTCARADLRPLALIPGRKLQVDWPHWGWWTVTVEAYDPDTGALRLSDGWSSKRFEIRDIRLPAKLTSHPDRQERRLATISRRALVRCGLLAGSVGLAAGVLLDQFLPLVIAFLR